MSALRRGTVLFNGSTRDHTCLTRVAGNASLNSSCLLPCLPSATKPLSSSFLTRLPYALQGPTGASLLQAASRACPMMGWSFSSGPLDLPPENESRSTVNVETRFCGCPASQRQQETKGCTPNTRRSTSAGDGRWYKPGMSEGDAFHRRKSLTT